MFRTQLTKFLVQSGIGFAALGGLSGCIVMLAVSPTAATNAKVAPVISPATLTAMSGNSSTFTVAGGATPITFSVVDGMPATGSTINSSSGAFSAGVTAGTTTVRATDALGRTSDATVTVVPVIAVTPSPGVTLSLGTDATFTPSGGVSASYSYSITGTALGSMSAASGASSIYRRPWASGSDVVKTMDSGGNFVSTTLTLTAGGLQFGTNAKDSADGIHVDTANGDIYIVGTAPTGKTILGTAVTGTGAKIYVAKYDSRGVFKTVTVVSNGATTSDTFGGSAWDDTNKKLYIAATVLAGAAGSKWDDKSLVNSAFRDLGWAQLDTSLVVTASGVQGVSGKDTYAKAIDVLDSASILVAGSTTGSYGGFALVGGKEAYLFNIKVSDNSRLATKEFGNIGDDEITAIRYDSGYGTLIAGTYTACAPTIAHRAPLDPIIEFASELVFGRTAWAMACGAGYFAGLYDKTFSGVTWSLAPSTSGSEVPASLGIDSSGRMYLAGSAASAPVDLTGTTISGYAGGKEGFFLSVDAANGTAIKSYVIGTASHESVTSVLVSGSVLYVIGTTTGALGGQTHAGGTDFYLQSYDISSSTPALNWTRLRGTVSTDVVSGLAVDPNKNIYIAGSTTGSLDLTQIGLGDASVSKFDSSGNLQ